MEDDRDLVERLKRGERTAFDEMYRTHRERVWVFLYRLSRRRDVAEDLFQETWLAAARNLTRLAPETRLLPWLYTIARHKHVSLHRSLLADLRRRINFAALPAPVVRRPDHEAVERQQSDRVAVAMASLPDDWREVLLLCLVEGMDTREVAEVLGLREDAVRKRLSRARTELHARLAGGDDTRGRGP